MPITVTNGLLLARQNYLDTDTTNASLSDAELLRWANEVYSLVRDKQSPRYIHEHSTTLGTAMTAGDFTVTTTLKTVAEIRALYVEAAATDITGQQPLQKAPLDRVKQLAFAHTSGYSRPRIYALQRLATFTAANQGAWVIHLWPAAGSVYKFISAMVRHEITELSAGSDVPDLTATEVYSLWRVVGALGATALRRTELAQGLMALVTPEWRAAFDVARVGIKPRSPEGEKVA